MKKFFILIALSFSLDSLSAQVLAWQFSTPASAGNEATYTATTINANLNTSQLSRGAGLSSSALDRTFCATNFTPSGTKADAITNNKYFSFTINSQAGFQTSLSTLDVRLRRSASGPNMFIWRYSIDGTNFTDIGTDINFTTVNADGIIQAQIDLSVISDLQNVTNATTITFRLYAWGASSVLGTFAIGRYAAGTTTNSLAIGGTVTPVSTNSAASDIITDASFITPSNINYSIYQGTVLTLANSIEVASFTLRDGGAAADADGVGTTLTSISFSLSNSANIRRVAIMDGATQLQEVVGAAIVTFSDPALSVITTADDGTKNFSLRVVFANNVTDNQQFQFTITATTAAFAGSQFAATNAGGAVSSIVSDENRIEVIADGLSYLTNTYSPTGNGVAMAPAVQVGGTDTLNFGGNLYTNLDLDFVEQINITSSGTLTSSPVTIAAIAGVATFSTLVHTVNGTGFTLKAERTITLDWDVDSNPFDIINPSSASDYFRSVQNGTWDNPTTWESSPDNTAWQPSSLVPNSLANNIYVRNTDTVTITTNANADQLIIENGGTLIQNNSPVFTIDNGSTPYDMILDPGGTFIMNGRQPVGLGSVLVAGSAHIVIATNTSPGQGDDFAFGSAAVAGVTFLNNSFYDWATTTSPSWSGRTYFTGGNSTYFRFLSTPSLGVGGASPTVINGVLQADANVTINGTGTKTFVNGIINAAQIDASLPTGGSINITGTNAELGDMGTILLPSAGLNIGPNTTVSCTTSPLTPTKTLNGNVSFGTNTKIFLTDTDLTITGNITGTSSISYFVTNGLSNAGKLIRPNVGVTPVEYPIGHGFGTYNPVTISNGDNLSYGVKVYNSIQPTSVFNDNNLVNRTWVIKPTGTPSAPVNVTFNYGPTDGNPGFNYASNVEVGLYTSVWNVIQSNITPTGTYNVTANVSAFGADIDAPMVIGNLGAILAVSKRVTLTATKQNNTSLLNWQSVNLANTKSYIIERSNNGINFVSIATKNSVTSNFIDANPLGGNNYYRIKCVEQNNGVVYSNVIIVRHNVDALSVSPSITAANTLLTINSNVTQKITMVITDALGQRISTNNIRLVIGENKLPIQASSLSSGLYLITIYFENGTTLTSRFIKQ